MFDRFTSFDFADLKISLEAKAFLLFLMKKSFHSHGICSLSLKEIEQGCFFKYGYEEKSKEKSKEKSYSKFSERHEKRLLKNIIDELVNLKIITCTKSPPYKNKYTLLDLSYAKSLNKSADNISDENAAKADRKRKKNEQKNTENHDVIPITSKSKKIIHADWAKELAQNWMNWNLSKEAYVDFTIDQYAECIFKASYYLDCEENMKYFMMNKIFNFIKSSRFWGISACTYPFELTKDFKNTIKIKQIIRDMQSVKNSAIDTLEELNNEQIRQMQNFEERVNEY